MARVNVNILGISELKWTGMGEFNSDDHYIYYFRLPGESHGLFSLWVCKESDMTEQLSLHLDKNPLEKMGVTLIVNKRV